MPDTIATPWQHHERAVRVWGLGVGTQAAKGSSANDSSFCQQFNLSLSAVGLAEVIRLGKSVVRAAWELCTGWATLWLAMDIFLVLPFLMEFKFGRKLHRALLAKQRKSWVSRAKQSGVVWFGPFVGEVGYELSYWIPWIRKFCSDLELEELRIGIVTRGGAQVWYPDHAHSLELFDELSADEFRRLQSAEYPTKLRSIEKHLIKLLGISRFRIAHPREMHAAISEFRGNYCGIDALGNYFTFAGLSKTTVADRIERLVGFNEVPTPKRFGSVRLYTNSLIGDEVAVQQAWRLVAAAAPDVDLVDVGVHTKLDDHIAVLPRSETTAAPLANCPLNLNLALQTLIILRSNFLVSTYGGSSYIGLLLGIPTLAIGGGSTFQKKSHFLFEEHIRDRLGVQFVRVNLSDEKAERQVGEFLATLPED
jgi:hypothetical protein